MLFELFVGLYEMLLPARFRGGEAKWHRQRYMDGHEVRIDCGCKRDGQSFWVMGHLVLAKDAIGYWIGPLNRQTRLDPATLVIETIKRASSGNGLSLSGAALGCRSADSRFELGVSVHELDLLYTIFTFPTAAPAPPATQPPTSQ